MKAITFFLAKHMYEPLKNFQMTVYFRFKQCIPSQKKKKKKIHAVVGGRSWLI